MKIREFIIDVLFLWVFGMLIIIFYSTDTWSTKESCEKNLERSKSCKQVWVVENVKTTDEIGKP